MGLSFVDSWLYKITLPIFIGLFVCVLISPLFKNWLIKRQRIISIVFALFSLGNIIAGEIAYVMNGNFNMMFLADMCPFSIVLSIPVLLINKEKINKMLMPWLIIGGLVTFATSTLGIKNFTPYMGFLSFNRHALMLLEGTFFYAIVSKYSKADFWRLLIVPSVLMGWILITLLPMWLSTGEDKWAIYSTGLLKPGYTRFYEHLTDSWVQNLLDVVTKTYPAPTFVFYAIAVTIAMGFAWTKKFERKRSGL